MPPAMEAEWAAQEEPVPVTVMLALKLQGPRVAEMRAVQLMPGARGYARSRCW
jgi:hypothetical protein